MRWFSFRPAFELRGREFHGVRGFAGKPLHPPLTDVPVGAYVLAAALDVGSVLASGPLREDLYRAGTFTLVGGGAVSLATAATGAADWWWGTPRRTQAWRTANAHALVMVTVTGLVASEAALRLTTYADRSATPRGLLALSLVIAALTTAGGALGGSLVYDYGFNVETAGDSPVWHESQTDLTHAGAR
jgi:uncharacterized membrane protein